MSGGRSRGGVSQRQVDRARVPSAPAARSPALMAAPRAHRRHGRREAPRQGPRRKAGGAGRGGAGPPAAPAGPGGGSGGHRAAVGSAPPAPRPAPAKPRPLRPRAPRAAGTCSPSRPRRAGPGLPEADARAPGQRRTERGRRRRGRTTRRRRNTGALRDLVLRCERGCAPRPPARSRAQGCDAATQGRPGKQHGRVTQPPQTRTWVRTHRRDSQDPDTAQSHTQR